MKQKKNLLFLIVFLMACGHPQKEPKMIEGNNPIATEEKAKQAKGNADRKDTPIVHSNLKGKTYPIIFEAAFDDETKVDQGGQEYRFEKNSIGQINVESKRIIACDPIQIKHGVAFTQDFPKGQFEVELAMAKTEKDERVAYSRILFSNKPVENWEFALLPGQEPISIKDSAFYCFGVDAGMAVFIDETANKVFSQKGKKEWEKVFFDQFEKTAKGEQGFVYEFDAHRLATFYTGFGDGCYASYIGFDENGKVSKLLSDFGIIEWWKDIE